MTVIMLTIAASSSPWFLPVIAGAALADSINPCAFSILFLTIAFLFSLGKDRRFILMAGGSYILGIALVYTLIGVGLLQVMSVFQIPNVMAKFGAIILALYAAIGLANELFPRFPLKLKIPTGAHPIIAKVVHKGSVPAALLLGVLVGMFEFPCTGGPYLFVLSLLHDQARFWSGFWYLITYNLIFVSPLIVILALASSRTALDKVERIRKLETKRGRIILDAALLAIGLVILLS